jgi:hypothetical protein
LIQIQFGPIDFKPSSLAENLRYAWWYAAVAGVIGVVQVQLLGTAAWWTAIGDGWPPTLSQLAIGALAGLVLLLIGMTVLRLSGAGDFSWTFKALAAIPPSHAAIVSLSLSAAILEELLFRAALVPTVGIVASAALFALAHVGTALLAPNPKLALWLMVDMMVFGIAMGYLFLQAGWWACVMAHLVHNLLGFYLARRAWKAIHAQWLAGDGTYVLKWP